MREKESAFAIVIWARRTWLFKRADRIYNVHSRNGQRYCYMRIANARHARSRAALY
jgi:Ser/Thr protein kinase RdoA (MazF antagonist)